jgi:endonuclease V-like protein UPF0215 family
VCLIVDFGFVLSFLGIPVLCSSFEASSMESLHSVMKKTEVGDDDVATRHWLPPV